MAINRIKALVLKSVASSAITGTYAAINPLGAEGACFMLRIANLSDTAVTVSYDGTHDNEVVLAEETLIISTNSLGVPAGRVALFPIGQKVYVKGTAGTGTIYLSGYYQPIGE
jgi:hypothetical protein